MVHRIYPAELQLNKANASDTEAAFLDLNVSIHNDIVSTKYKLIRFARASSHVTDFNNCNKFLTAKLSCKGSLPWITQEITTAT